MTGKLEPARIWTASPATTCRRTSSGRIPARPAGLPYPARLNCAVGAAGPQRGARPRRPSRHRHAGRDADLRRARRAGEPHRQRAGAASSAWCPATACCCARANNAWMVACLFRRAEGGRRRGRDHAAAARQGARRDLPQGARSATPSATPAGRGAGARPEAPHLRHVVHWGDGDAGGAVRRGRAADFAACRHRRRRHLPDRLHLGHHGRAEGHAALPPRHAGDLRRTIRRRCCKPEPTDCFIGSPPLAFTFGLGGLVLFPLARRRDRRAAGEGGAGRAARRHRAHRATICFTAPTAYRAMAARRPASSTSRRLRKCVSAGEHLPQPIFDAWKEATGLKLMDGIGATEMLHIFIARAGGGDPARRHRPAGAGLRGARHRTRRRASCRAARPAGSPCAARPAAATSPTRASANYVAARLEHHRRHLRPG